MSARATAIAAGLGAAAMLGLAFAAEPLYSTFCQVTGFGGTTRRADAGDGPITPIARTVRVRFDANVASSAGLTFTALQTSQTVRLGEHGLAYFRVENTTDHPVAAMASYNVTPHRAGPYFVKLECFCFQEQVFEPGESREIPVVYYVHPRLAEEERMDHVHTITLSYTFFAVDDDAYTLAHAAGAGRVEGG